MASRRIHRILIALAALEGLCVECVRIRDLIVPALVELGSEDVILECDYDYEEGEKLQLEVKWYFNGEPTPFYQWLPGSGHTTRKPQVIGDRFRPHLDLSYVGHGDAFKRHSSLRIRRPTLALSGSYACKVSSFVDEDMATRDMVVYSPARFVRFEQERSLGGHSVNVTCVASGVFPMPRVKLTWGPYQLDDSDSSVTTLAEEGTFDVVVHRVVSHDDLSANAVQTVFGCELSIPGTEYSVREESVYYHGGRSHHTASRISSSATSLSLSTSAVGAIFLLAGIKNGFV